MVAPPNASTIPAPLAAYLRGTSHTLYGSCIVLKNGFEHHGLEVQTVLPNLGKALTRRLLLTQRSTHSSQIAICIQTAHCQIN